MTVLSDGLIQLWCLEDEAFGIASIKIQVMNIFQLKKLNLYSHALHLQFTVSSTHLFYITASYLPSNSLNQSQTSRKDSFVGKNIAREPHLRTDFVITSQNNMILD
jgi:hypothetical protein